MTKYNRGINENNNDSNNSRNQPEQKPKNPFKDSKTVNNQPTEEEEARLEQERKETLTERD